MPCEHFTEAWQQAQVWDSSPALQGGTQLESTSCRYTVLDNDTP